VALSQEVFGSKFWALGGLNQKVEEQRFVECHMERDDGQKLARFHRKTKKKNQFEGA